MVLRRSKIEQEGGVGRVGGVEAVVRKEAL